MAVVREAEEGTEEKKADAGKGAGVGQKEKNESGRADGGDDRSRTRLSVGGGRTQADGKGAWRST